MGFMAQIKLKHVNSFYDRHGKLRHLFRYPGTKSLTLPGLPGSPDFVSNRLKSVQSERWSGASMLPS
jgi:hypothetical protein